MSIAAVTPVYYGQTAGQIAQGQVYGTNSVGPENRILKGIATAVLDGSATTFTVNYVDGVQKLYLQTINIGLQSATAPATINGVANQSIISGVGAFGQLQVGQSIVTTGFANSGNNGTFTINAVAPTGVQVTNASAVAESNSFSAVGVVTIGPKVAFVQAGRSLVSAANATDTATSTITATPSAFTQTGFTVTISGAGSASQTLSVFVIIYPAQ